MSFLFSKAHGQGDRAARFRAAGSNCHPRINSSHSSDLFFVWIVFPVSKMIFLRYVPWCLMIWWCKDPSPVTGPSSATSQRHLRCQRSLEVCVRLRELDCGCSDSSGCWDCRRWWPKKIFWKKLYIYVLDLTSNDLQLNEMGCLNHHLPCGKTKIHWMNYWILLVELKDLQQLFTPKKGWCRISSQR